MKEAGKNRHIVDLLLPIALFLVLAASSLFLVFLLQMSIRKMLPGKRGIMRAGPVSPM